MGLENAGPTRAEVATQLLTYPVGERRDGIEQWLDENYGKLEVNGKSVTFLIMSDIESYPELTNG